MQRLFSTFPNGWPGRGLLIFRLVLALAVARNGIFEGLAAPFDLARFGLPLVATAGVLFLILGLCTPIAAGLIIIAELWIAIAKLDSLGLPIMLAALAAALAMLGPGAWSIDARLFGRRRI